MFDKILRLKDLAHFQTDNYILDLYLLLTAVIVVILMCKNHREDKFLRATNYKHYGCDNNSVSPKRTRKTEKKSKRKGFKALSYAIAVSLAAVALVVPTTTLAPDVDAFEDSRAASLAVGSINDFSLVITDNCVEETTVPVTQEITTSAAATQKTTEKKTKSAKTAKTAKKSEASQTSKKTESSKSEPSESEVSQQITQSSASSSASSSDDSSSASNSSDYSYTDNISDSSNDQSGYLVSISNPDPSYSPSPVSLSSYDREKLERLVMGEGGSMGYAGCALIAQSIRDAMNRSNTTSIDRIISEYRYYGSTAYAPSQEVKNAVSFIFDQNGSAVQHRVLCFYTGSSSWHESQNYITSIGSVKFFDLWY